MDFFLNKTKWNIERTTLPNTKSARRLPHIQHGVNPPMV